MWINIAASLYWRLAKYDPFRTVNVLNRILSSRLSHNCSHQRLLQSGFVTKLSHANVIPCKCWMKSYFSSAVFNSHFMPLQLNSKIPSLVHQINYNSFLIAMSHHIHSSGLKHANLMLKHCMSFTGLWPFIFWCKHKLPRNGLYKYQFTMTNGIVISCRSVISTLQQQKLV